MARKFVQPLFCASYSAEAASRQARVCLVKIAILLSLIWQYFATPLLRQTTPMSHYTWRLKPRRPSWSGYLRLPQRGISLRVQEGPSVKKLLAFERKVCQDGSRRIE
jgi:hypothetical protein